LGVFEIAFLHSQTGTVNDLKEAIRQEISSDRSSVVGPCHGRF